MDIILHTDVHEAVIIFELHMTGGFDVLVYVYVISVYVFSHITGGFHVLDYVYVISLYMCSLFLLQCLKCSAEFSRSEVKITHDRLAGLTSISIS